VKEPWINSSIILRDKDEHISALMERLKTVSKGYEQHKILHSDLTTMPESGYNTRMNEDQQLLTHIQFEP
jgi:hypothetical protein